MDYFKIFKNSNIIYFKYKEDFVNIDNISKIFRGKIIISDSHEINKICNIYGIIHVYNTNSGWIPNENIDCIISNNNGGSNDLEYKITKFSLGIPVLYLTEKKKWCGICNSSITLQNIPVSKYCSETCMKKDNGFPITKVDNIIVNSLEPTDFIISKKNKKLQDKSQSSQIRSGIRLVYAIKRVSYKKEMKQPSLRKTSSNKLMSDTKIENFKTERLCKGITKKGNSCSNKCIGNSNYCGILIHSIKSDINDPKIFKMFEKN